MAILSALFKSRIVFSLLNRWESIHGLASFFFTHCEWDGDAVHDELPEVLAGRLCGTTFPHCICL